MEEEKLTSEKEIYDITVIGGGPVGLLQLFAGLRGISVK